MVKLLAIPVGKRILQIGCGRGIALPSLTDLCRPTNLTGIDIDGDALTDAAQLLGAGSVNTELVRADVRDMPFQNQSFDIAIDFGTSYHTSNPHRALKEIVRVLAVGGMLVHETMLGQLLSHPTRFYRQKLCWDTVPSLVTGRNAALWATRIRK